MLLQTTSVFQCLDIQILRNIASAHVYIYIRCRRNLFLRVFVSMTGGYHRPSANFKNTYWRSSDTTNAANKATQNVAVVSIVCRFHTSLGEARFGRNCAAHRRHSCTNATHANVAKEAEVFTCGVVCNG